MAAGGHVVAAAVVRPAGGQAVHGAGQGGGVTVQVRSTGCGRAGGEGGPIRMGTKGGGGGTAAEGGGTKGERGGRGVGGVLQGGRASQYRCSVADRPGVARMGGKGGGGGGGARTSGDVSILCVKGGGRGEVQRGAGPAQVHIGVGSEAGDDGRDSGTPLVPGLGWAWCEPHYTLLR